MMRGLKWLIWALFNAWKLAWLLVISSAAWDTWSKAAERALADAYCLAGGPMPLGGVLRLGRGRLVPSPGKAWWGPS